MSQLVIADSRGESSHFIRKRVCTVGSERVHDIQIDNGLPGVQFTILQEERSVEVVPGAAKLRLNSILLSKRTTLKSCDRLEWEGARAVFIDSAVPAVLPGKSPSLESLSILQELAQLQQRTDPASAFRRLLEVLVETAGAEEGFILSDWGDQSGWRLVASNREEGAHQRRKLFSDSIVAEVLEKRSLIFVESIIGSPYADALSVIQGRIFSVACFPLLVGDRLLGAVVLQSRSPGKSVRRASLNELSVLAAQAALFLAASAELKAVKTENSVLRKNLTAQDSGFIFRSAVMGDVVNRITKIAGTSLGVLIQGETGSGKEVAANEIHRKSSRASSPFVALNCAAIPPTLLESALFGHERGAFTGAVKAQQGKFELADKGTLFLDEIGDLSMELQAKLLRVLQERVVERVGSNQARAIDVRVIAATHRNLEKMIKAGQFRQDLYFRLAGVVLRLPPLRQRVEDIEALAEHFLARAAADRTLSDEAMAALRAHPWPGNVRELDQVVTRAALLAEGPAIIPSDLDLMRMEIPVEEDALFWEDFETLSQAQLALTRRIVESALQKNRGNRSQTAERLGISERTLYRIISERAESAENAEGADGAVKEA